MFDLYYKYSTSSWLIRFLVFLKVMIMMGIVVMNAKMIKTSTEIVAKYYAPLQVYGRVRDRSQVPQTADIFLGI